MSVLAFASTGAEIGCWSEPLVADCVYADYERMLGGAGEAAASLGRRHCRMWRNLLQGETQRAHLARHDLLLAARRAGLDAAAIETIDDRVFDELLGVVLRRCATSRTAARSDGKALVLAASKLGEIRTAA